MNILKSNRFFVLEWLVLVKFCCYVIGTVGFTIIVQDKVCLGKYNQTMNFCQNINSIKDEEGIEMVDKILKDSSRTLVEFLPTFLWSFLVGSFLDRFAAATRILLVLSQVGDLILYLITLANVYFYHWSAYWILLSSCQVVITGGLMSFFTSIFRYIALTTDERKRSVKYAIFEACLTLGLSSGNFLTGKLLALNDLGADRARTYFRYYIFAIVLTIVSIGLIFGLKQIGTVQEEQAEKNKKKNETETEKIAALEKVEGINNLEEETEPSRRTSSISAIIIDEIVQIKNETKEIATKLFSFENVRATIKCLLRQRPNRARATIWMLLFVQVIQTLVFFCIENFFLQFSEKAYHWDATTFTTFSAISKIGGTLFLTVWLAIFVKYFKVEDRKLVITGIVSFFFYQTILGTFMSPLAYIISMPLASFGGLISVAVRSMVAKIVDTDETGKIFSLILTLESTLPFLSSLIYANLFAATLDFHPGLIYQLSGFFLFCAFLVYICEDLYTQSRHKDEDVQDNQAQV